SGTQIVDSFAFSILLVLRLLASYLYSWLALHSLPLGPFLSTILLIQAAHCLLAFSFSNLELLQPVLLRRGSRTLGAPGSSAPTASNPLLQHFCQHHWAQGQYIRSQHRLQHQSTISYHRCIHLLLTIAVARSMAEKLSCILVLLLCPLQPVTLWKINVSPWCPALTCTHTLCTLRCHVGRACWSLLPLLCISPVHSVLMAVYP
ncbi:UNVERIFIED_CONTAM: hypothetical protein H355_001294, partial [Colinus virginianus]